MLTDWRLRCLWGVFLTVNLDYHSNESQLKLSNFQNPTRLHLHPLDPLTALEITEATRIVNGFHKGNWKFNWVTLKEPEKSILLPFFLLGREPPMLSIPRRAFIVLIDRLSGETSEVIVNLDSSLVEKWNKVEVDNKQAPITLEEISEGDKILREDPKVQERCKHLGWSNMHLVVSEPWGRGYVKGREDLTGKRLVQYYMYGRNHETDNYYAHPFNFLVVVDLNASQVVSIEDLPTHDEGFDSTNTDGNIVVPRTASNYLPSLRNPSSFRSDLNPVHHSQSKGPSFVIIGNSIHWQKFSFRIGFNGREGLVIHHLRYNDGGIVRPLFYRMSLAMLFNPFADPRPPFHRKTTFDIGDYGVGNLANELEPQIDCIGEIRMIDAILNNENGEPVRRRNVICIFEQDDAVMWRHMDPRNKNSSKVRSQKLVLTYVSTVGNYDYIISWQFFQDATIDLNIKISGIASTNLLAVNASSGGYGSIVMPQINAQYHQHFFTVRLDAEIDGNKNAVDVHDVIPLRASTGSRENPYGQGYTTRITPLKTTAQSKTNIAPNTSRVWNIRNSRSINPFTKEPVAWKLMPWPSPKLFIRKDSPIHDAMDWLDYNTFVTPYVEDQLFPDGFYPNNSEIEDEDIVLWHNFGLTYIPRTEDFPVMPVETCGITLKPQNFFFENPALDIPPSRFERNHKEL